MAYRVSHAWAWRVVRKRQQLSSEGCRGPGRMQVASREGESTQVKAGEGESGGARKGNHKRELYAVKEILNSCQR